MGRAATVLLLALCLAPSLATADVAPRRGGELTLVVPGEPLSYDAHREESLALLHPIAPHYSTLLRVDPDDRSGTKLIGDVAESWTVADDGHTYAVKLRRDVRFHDGSEMTSRDVKASYDKIIFPPAGVVSARKAAYEVVQAVEAPQADTVVFRLAWPSATFLASLASPWNWIYKADLLAADVRWYETHVMGTGPFVFVEHARGSHWVGARNPAYWDPGKPYLDGYRAIFGGPAAPVAPVEVRETPGSCALLVALNHQRTPFGNKRMRRALMLAIDRDQGPQPAAGPARPAARRGQARGTPFVTSPAELLKIAGSADDVEEARAEARRLLQEAGVPEHFAFTLKTRAVHQAVGRWLIEEWRTIGLDVSQEVLEPSAYVTELRRGRFQAAVDVHCGHFADPALDLYKFRSTPLSPANYARYTDKVLDELYRKQSRALDPDERRRYVRAFERRLLDEEAHYLYTLQWRRVVPHLAKVGGALDNQLDRVWLVE
jgi:peptide/nickel transport system substrate-binding protein